MPLADLWTQATINVTVRRELMDPTGTTNWSWSDIELTQYIGDWQNLLQDRFEFVWGSSTITNTGGTSTILLTNVATNMLRPGNIWWNNYRIIGRNKEEMEILVRDWRGVNPNVAQPEICYQDDANSVSFWPPPPPTTTNTVVFEYPVVVSFTTNTTPMSIPAWTKYSAVNYIGFRCYSRPGPQQDLQRAARYKSKFIKQGMLYRKIWEQHFPDKAPSLRLGGRYEGDILNAGMHNTLFQTWF